MLTQSDSKNVIFVLELQGDIPSTGGIHIIEIGGVSTDRSKLELIRDTKQKEMNDLMERDEDEDEDSDEEFCYGNTDYTSCPEWVVVEYPLL